MHPTKNFGHNGVLCFLFVALTRATDSSVVQPTATGSLTFVNPSGYATNVYNVSAATTTISYSYSDEELALLWDQVGSITPGVLNATVSPTPEPSAYPRPGPFHPQV
jgi:hypothetical protein